MGDFDFGMPYCKRCDTDTCSACERKIEKHLCHTNRNSNVVLCLSCESRGCTLREPRLYRCDECEQSFGATVYDSKQLWNFKLRQTPLFCKTCMKVRPRRFAKLRFLVTRSERICKCNKKLAPGLHLESCLTSATESKQRWPGSDQGVTRRDFKYLQRWQPDWWNKALGQRKTAKTLKCVVCKLAKRQSKYPDSVWLHQQMKEERQLRCRACMKCPECQEMLTVRDFTKDSTYCRDCERKQHVQRSKRMRVTAYDHQVLQKSQPDWWKKARKDMIAKYENIVRKHNPTYWQTRT